MVRAFAILSDYWYPSGDIVVDPKQGAPSGYTFTDPTVLNPSKDQWVRRGNNAFWELTDIAPAWDIQYYQNRLADALLKKRRELEDSFIDRLTLGMVYDFGEAGIAAKLTVNGNEVPLRRIDQTIIQTLTIDASHGVLHVQARGNDRSNLMAIESGLNLLSQFMTNPVIGFVMAENVTIDINMALWQQVAGAMLQWYGAIFGEYGGYKAVLDSYNNISDIENFTWTWNN